MVILQDTMPSRQLPISLVVKGDPPCMSPKCLMFRSLIQNIMVSRNSPGKIQVNKKDPDRQREWKKDKTWARTLEP